MLTTITGNVADPKIDPLVEILKHAFVLRLSLRRMLEAKELESLISELYIQEDNTDAVISTLQLLVELKSFQIDTGATLVSILLIVLAQSVFRLLSDYYQLTSKLTQIKFYLECISLW